MTQTTVIIGALLFAFFVYVTAKGQLPSYLAVFI